MEMMSGSGATKEMGAIGAMMMEGSARISGVGLEGNGIDSETVRS